jgi:hypothetical protein
MQQSPLHERTKAALHISLPQAERYLTSNHPELVACLKAISALVTSEPLTENLELRQSVNCYLTHIRQIVWNDSVHQVSALERQSARS